MSGHVRDRRPGFDGFNDLRIFRHVPLVLVAVATITLDLIAGRDVAAENKKARDEDLEKFALVAELFAFR